MKAKTQIESHLLVLVTLGLVAFGLVMVYSATSAPARAAARAIARPIPLDAPVTRTVLLLRDLVIWSCGYFVIDLVHFHADDQITR